MYTEHGYTAEEIHDRLRYRLEDILMVIEKYRLEHGEKSWRY